MAQELINVHISGTSPCIMQADTLTNPLHPMTKRMKAINAKGKKMTDEDREEKAEIQFMASLYYDKKLGPYWPSQNILRCLRDGATRTKQGKDTSRGFEIVDDRNPLLYEGPRTPETLIKNQDFVDCRSVVIGKARVMCTRPVFTNWQLKFGLVYDTEIFADFASVRAIVETAGRYVGLSTFRPRYGRFDVVEMAA